VLYATHPYNNAPERLPANWESYWGFLAETQSVIVTEFGDPNAQCSGEFNQQLIDFADSHHVSWTSWARFPSGCQFPSIIADWAGTPTVQGEPVRAALMGYQDPPATSPAAAGVDAPDDAASGTDTGIPTDGANPDPLDGGGD
jgi:hypothetical protein